MLRKEFKEIVFSCFESEGHFNAVAIDIARSCAVLVARGIENTNLILNRDNTET